MYKEITVAVISILILASSVLANPAHPYPHSVTYPFGSKPRVAQESMNRTVQIAYQDWINRYLTKDGCPPGTRRIQRVKPDNYDTVSEGIGWGMLITVLMDNEKNNTQDTFDKLWIYYRSFLNSSGLMAWHISKDGEFLNTESATEAEENVAIALLYADKQWGSDGAVNYRQQAKELITKIMVFEVESNTFVLKPGIHWGGTDYANPAYFDTAFYRIWASFDKDWQKVKDKCFAIYDYFYGRYQTGLYPDWCRADGTRSDIGYDFYYDACQVPLKIGLDYLWNGVGDKYLIKLNDWLIKKTSGDPSAIVDGYRLDGTTFGKYHNAAYTGPLCVAAMVDKKYQSWLNKLYQDLVDLGTGGDWGYYQDTLRLVSLLVVSGNMPNLF